MKNLEKPTIRRFDLSRDTDSCRTDMNIFVPHDQLRPDTLWAVIEDFVTRDGAIQGHLESPLAVKMQAVHSALQAGTVVIVFNEGEETLSIVPEEEWRKLSQHVGQPEDDHRCAADV